MISLFPLAFAAGVLTVAAPCLLPVLPGILGGSLGRSKWRPLWIVAGLVTSFTIFGTAFAIFLDVLGISKGTLRIISIALLFVFGVALAVPALYEWVITKAAFAWRKVSASKVCCAPEGDHNPSQPPLTFPPKADRPRAERGGGVSGDPPLKVRGGRGSYAVRNGFWGAFGIGATLGVVWTPCAGPIFGAILTLAATTHNIVRSGILFFAYALGAGLPMLLIGYGGRALVLRIKGFTGASARIRQVGGLILVIWAVALYFGIDRYFQANLAPFLPQPKL